MWCDVGCSRRPYVTSDHNPLHSLPSPASPGNGLLLLSDYEHEHEGGERSGIELVNLNGSSASRTLSPMKKHILWMTTLLSLVLSSHAFPPTPDHLFYGMIRNEWGEPLDVNGARVFILSTNGIGAHAPVTPSTQPGINYRLTVPMDSGRSPKGNALTVIGLLRQQAFQLTVQIGAVTYLPIEMVVTHPLGEPAGTTRLDLTLGIDTDGDGLPDAWELANGLDPNDPNDANQDSDGDGLSNRDEYLAGTFAFDANDGFRLALSGLNNGNATLEFLAIRGRTYTLQTSDDVVNWTTVPFRVLTPGMEATLLERYESSDVRTLRVEVPFQGETPRRYYRAMVQ